MAFHRGGAIVVSLAVGLSACATAQPRQRPLPTTPINQGADSMSAVRARLQGNWELESLTVTGANGRVQRIDATGNLSADAFGGLAIEYRISPSGQQDLVGLGIDAPTPVFSVTGRVVIDPQQQRITYVSEDFTEKAFDPKLAANRANPFAIEHVRHYVFNDDDRLTLSTRYPDGKDAAVGQWRRLK